MKITEFNVPEPEPTPEPTFEEQLRAEFEDFGKPKVEEPGVVIEKVNLLAEEFRAQFNEDPMVWTDDGDTDMVNPMPVVSDDDVYDYIEDVDHALAQHIPNREMITKGEEFASALEKVQHKMGSVQNVPISQIVSTEKYLYKDQIQALMKGRAKSSSAIPVLYKQGNKYFPGDGNHRIVAGYLSKQNSIKGLVLDGDKLLHEGVGLIRKGSNVTPDVGEAQTRIEAEKLGFKTTDDGIPPLLRTNGKSKVSESVIVEARRDSVLLVDFQPAYDGDQWGYREALQNAIEYINAKQPNVTAYYNGGEMGYEDEPWSIMEHFEENGLNPELVDNFTFKEKTYGFFRNWMDEDSEYGQVPVDPSITIRVIRYMVANNIHVSSEIPEEDWVKLVGEDFIYFDEEKRNDWYIYLPDEISIANLKTLEGSLVGGGGKHQCLKELQLLMSAFNIKHKEVQDWIYG